MQKENKKEKLIKELKKGEKSGFIKISTVIHF